MERNTIRRVSAKPCEGFSTKSDKLQMRIIRNYSTFDCRSPAITPIHGADKREITMKYTITLEHDSPAIATTTFERKRRDAAAHILWREIYDVLAHNGGLDTRWGWKAYQSASRARDPKLRSLSFYIGATGYKVSFAAKLA